jgi:dephospho-CoA kinase
LADKVFADSEALAALNRIVHPAVGVEMMRRIDAQRNSQRVVVLDVPLLAENPRIGLGGVLVVDLDPVIAVQRLVEQRGLNAQDAQARISKQASRQQRRAIADWIIDNSGSRLELARQVGAAWQWMCSLPPAASDAGRVARSTNS